MTNLSGHRLNSLVDKEGVLKAKKIIAQKQDNLERPILIFSTIIKSRTVLPQVRELGKGDAKLTKSW